MAEQPMLEYLAQKVVDDLRAGVALDEALGVELTQYPQIDYLRQQVATQDVEMLLRTANSTNQGMRALAHALMPRLQQDERIREYLLWQWRDTPREDYAQCRRLMWLLLNYDDLDTDIHREIYDFICCHLEHWLEDVVIWCGGPAEVLPAVQARLADPLFPESKAWVYLMCGLAEEDPARRCEFGGMLPRYEHSNASIVADVVRYLQGQL